VNLKRIVIAACVLAGAVLSGQACASSAASNTATVTESSPDRITVAEISATSGANSAYDLVRRLRPRWLQATATGSIGGGSITSQAILVYLDGIKLGGVESLKTLTPSGITGMQYLDAVRAATVLRDVGSEPIGGAIVITTH
jgi:hypothetical protein